MRRALTTFAGVATGIVIAVLAGSPALATVQHAPPPEASQRAGATVALQTVPPLSGVRFRFDGYVVRTDSEGRASVGLASRVGEHTLDLLDTSVVAPDRRYEFVRWAGQRDPDQAFRASVTGLPTGSYTVTAGFRVSYPVTPTFFNEDGEPMSADDITSVALRSDAGDTVELAPDGTTWVIGGVPSYRQGDLELSDVTYSVSSVIVNGSNVVTAGRLKYQPSAGPALAITVPLHTLTITTRDALFGWAVGRSAIITGPDGVTRTIPLSPGGAATATGLPRGKYLVDLTGAAGTAMRREVNLSRDMAVEIRVVGPLDLAVVGLSGLIVAVGLILVGRPRSRRAVRNALRRGLRWASRIRIRRRSVKLAGGVAAGVLLLLAAMPAGEARADPVPQASAPPVGLFAYYYSWFDPSSWDRAKIDYPLLGHYSSDDATVIRQQIQWAKDAGIGGFIVSWKDTPTNDRRLHLLMTISGELDFKLAMIYQGLDFDRNPQPAQRVAADFKTFRDKYASDPVFYRLGGKPLTIWSGTWAFSHDDVASVTDPVRNDLLVLATEKSVDGYLRISDLVDGDAYYWSSVNPDTNSNYDSKLVDMSDAVHADQKFWVAPFAPGFDARLVGGTTEVLRKDGATLRREYGAAVNSSPDLLGLISWNEFSENTYVEPSELYGRRYLDVLKELRSTGAPDPVFGADSSGSENAATLFSKYWSNVLILAAFPAALTAITVVSARRRRRALHPPKKTDPSPPPPTESTFP